MQRNRTLNLEVCRALGVHDKFVDEWKHGVRLDGHDVAPAFNVPDPPSIEYGYDRASEEIDRLAAEGKIWWYEDNEVPVDIDICPSTLVVKNSRMRLVHGWSRVGLNECLVVPETSFATIDSLLNVLRPGCHIAGLDVKDCFLHWPVHASCRHRLGVRHAWTGQVGVYLFLPPGLSPAPGINERNMAEATRVATQHMPLCHAFRR